MLKFLYQAQDRSGRPVKATIEAASAADARDQLEQQGCTAIQFFDDELMARLRAERPVLEDADPAIIAELEVRMQKAPGVWPVLWASLKGSSGFLFMLGCLLVIGWLGDMAWLAVLAVLVLAAFLTFFAYQYQPAYWYDQVLRAYSHGDWERTRESSERLKHRVADPHVHFDLDVRIASIAAKQGRLQEGVDLLAPWQEKLGATNSIYPCRLAGVYGMGGDTATLVRLMGEACELAPGNATHAIDYAMALARFDDVDAAEAVLAATVTDNLPAQNLAFLNLVRGQIHLRRGRNEAAVGEFATAQRVFNEFAGNPAMWTMLAFTASLLALALARQGDRRRAQAFFQPVAVIANAHADPALLAMLNKEVLGSA